jgi:epoxyqueuosine reductase
MSSLAQLSSNATDHHHPMILEDIARNQLKEQAEKLGFQLVGFTPAADASTYPELCNWLENGFDASMSYIERRKHAYEHPSGVLENCKSLMLLALPYPPHPWTLPCKATSRSLETSRIPARDNQLSGTIGSYAMPKTDYHSWIRNTLKPLLAELRKMFPNSHSRIVVDTAPLLERHFAQRAGLGWIGKNTLLLNKKLGSYFFLAAILTDANLGANSHPPQTQASHCGSCQACIEACPTNAFVAPYVLNANRCISYWTIEHQGHIPPEFRKELGPWIFGCDACQIVCPWNRLQSKNPTTLPPPEPMKPNMVSEKSNPLFWLELTPENFTKTFKDTPFYRTGLLHLQRNSLCVAANLKMIAALPTIEKFLSHPDPTLQETARWAIESLRTIKSLTDPLPTENPP